MGRIYLKDDEDPIILKPGDYCIYRGIWYCNPPSGIGLGNLGGHKIVEHEDGTITVSPSILIKTGTKPESAVYHGYLRKGIWSNC